MIDYKSFAEKKQGQQEETAEAPTTGPERTVWWKAEKVHRALHALESAMELEQLGRRQLNSECNHLFGEAMALPNAFQAALSQGMVPITPYLLKGRVTYNLVRVAVETLAAKLAKNRPKVTFTTDGGDWAAQRRAKRADRWVFGTFHAGELYSEMRGVFLDGCISDTGFLKVYRAGERICFERTDPDEVRVSRLDGHYRKPRTALHVRLVPREVLHGMVEAWNPKATKVELLKLHAAIDRANPPGPEYPAAVAATGDMVVVREAWHLPTDEEGTHGRHAIAINTATLLDEGYKRQRLPFVPFRFSMRRWGYYGQGVVERLAARQQTLNKKLRTLDSSLHLMSYPRYFLPQNAQFDVQQMKGGEPGMVWRGLQPPQVLTGNVIPPELFASIETDIRQGLEEVGVSLLSATARKPAGIDSAVALRELSDQESERFALLGQDWEEAFVHVGHHVVELGREAAEEGLNVGVLVETKRRNAERLERVAWKELALDKAKYTLKAFPTSSLPTTPAARRQAIMEWVQAGWIDDLEARRLMDVPDLEAANSVALAAREDIDATVFRFLDGDDDEDLEGLYEPPEPYQDLAYGLKRFQSEYLRARTLGAPEGRLELLRTWMADAKRLLDASQPPPQQAQPPALPANPAQQA